MAATLVDYKHEDGVAVIRMDDGKRNALSPDMLKQLFAALDRAEADGAAVVLTGREDVFSAGFDLKVMKAGGPATVRMLQLGYTLTARVLAYPYPVVAACGGHVFAMGVFLMLAADYVVAARGDYKVSANEVAIGITMPRVAAAMLEHRLTPAAYQRAVNLSETFDVDSALDAGFFDELVETGDLMPTALAHAAQFKALNRRAHTATKRRVRRRLIRHIRISIPLDLLDAVWLAVRGPGGRQGRPS